MLPMNTEWLWCSQAFVTLDIDPSTRHRLAQDHGEQRRTMKPTVAIIGLGLIGGSLGQALRKSKRYRVIGFARKPAVRRAAKRAHAVDDILSSWNKLKSADIVVLATPVSTIVPLIAKLKPFLKSRAIVTDVGSVKGVMHRNVRGVRFVGSHPLAGSHKTGVGAARADLFRRATCVIVPKDRSAARAVKAMWQVTGARVMELSASQHDALVALSSHLPHLIAHALIRVAMKSSDQRRLKALMAGSFRDVTRVASADADQWAQIFRENVSAVESALARFLKEVQQLKRSLRRSNLSSTLKPSQAYRSSLFHGI